MVLDQMRPQRAVMVGDRKGDFLAGRDNGLPTVSACYGYGLPMSGPWRTGRPTPWKSCKTCCWILHKEEIEP